LVSGSIIAVTGVDGSGKTTIARMLALHLSSRGFRVKVVWVKSLHTLAYLVYRLMRALWGAEYVVNPSGVVVEHYATRYMAGMGGLWGLIEYLSLLPHLLRVWLLSSLGYAVICDRFIPDFLATVSLRVGDELWWARSILGRHLLALQVRQRCALLDAGPRVVLARRPDAEYTRRELEKLIAIYRTVARQVGAQLVRATRPPSLIAAEILKLLSRA